MRLSFEQKLLALFAAAALVVARQLGLLGLRVQTAADGREALALWHQQSYALVITDINMPGMDGYALARAIRTGADARPARIPVLAWTANAMPDVVAKCQAAGMDDILVKPSELRQLQALVAKWLPQYASAVVPQGNSGTDPASVAPDGAAAVNGVPPAIDMRRLHDALGSNPEQAALLLHKIRDAMGRTVPEVSTALAMGDYAVIAGASHKLRGSAGMIGALPLAALCQQIETAAVAADAAALDGMGGTFAAESRRTLAALDALDPTGQEPPAPTVLAA